MTAQIPVGDGGARLERVAAMLCDAVDLLTRAMQEIKGERGHRDDGDASGAPDGELEQPG